MPFHVAISFAESKFSISQRSVAASHDAWYLGLTHSWLSNSALYDLYRCLATVDPANCPLCRKPFLIERMKKLHVDKPESLDEVKEADFLQRLIRAWDASEEELVSLLNDIGGWLENKEDDEVRFLRCGRSGVILKLFLVDR